MGSEADIVPKTEPSSHQQPNLVGPKAKTKRDGLYIHPKGKLSKQIKVSCSPCISGHRSGECNHFDRILLQIRAAGRPSNTCHHSASCGGACLMPKAFVIPGEEPKWCRNHRFCIENWEYSDYCPAYPVSSKRKVPSSSPSRNSEASSNQSSVQKGASEEQIAPHRRSSASCCAPRSSLGRIGPYPASVVAPLGQPVMVNASLQMSPTGTHPGTSPESLFPQIQLPQPSITSSLESELFDATSGAALLSSIPRTSSISDLDSYAFTFPQLSNRAELFSQLPSNEYYTDSASYQDDLAAAQLHELDEFLAPTTGPSYPSISTATSPATTGAPSLLPPQTHITAQEPQQCPGNGFQCPCDDNCLCVDCYTHSSGFWGLQVNLDNVQDAIADYQAPPLELSPSPPAAQEQQAPRSNSRPSSRNNGGHGDGDGNVDAGFADPQDASWIWR